MSGGKKYRLSLPERELFRDPITLIQPVLARLEPGEVRLQLDDPEMTVTSEELPQGTRFLIEYPLDNDNRTNTGRLYLQDEFVVSRDDLKLQNFKRSFRQDIERDKRIPFWVDLAKADHPGIKHNDRRRHLEKFLDDLRAIPTPPVSSNDLTDFQEKVLKKLHRPLPDNFKKNVATNPSILNPIAGVISPLGVAIDARDPQSGVSMFREGNKIIIKMVLVLDNSVGTDPIAKEFSRIYLRDNYELDAASLELLAFNRSFEPTLHLDNSLAQAMTEIAKLPAPPADSPEVKNFALQMAQGLGLEPKAPAVRPSPISNKLFASHLARARNFSAARQETARWGLGILRAATDERVKKGERLGHAWLRSSSHDPNVGYATVDDYFSRLTSYLDEHSVSLEDGLVAVTANNDSERNLKAALLTDPTLSKILSALQEPDAAFRQSSLVRLIRSDLGGENAWSGTIQAIFATLDPADPEVKALAAFYSGGGSFGERLEMLLPHVVHEAASPAMLGSMALASTAASLAKLTFIQRLGNSTRLLQLGAESSGLAAEVPAFVATRRILQRAWQGPEASGISIAGELGGAFLSFGVLRAAGIGTTRLNRYLQTRYFNPELALESFANPLTRAVFRFGRLRPWMPDAVQSLAVHGGGLASLTLANSLSRAVEFRNSSPQGWSFNLVDDLLMYGQFLVGGRLAQRMREGSMFKEIDENLAWFEQNHYVPSASEAANLSASLNQAAKGNRAIQLWNQLIHLRLRAPGTGQQPVAAITPSTKSPWLSRASTLGRAWLARITGAKPKPVATSNATEVQRMEEPETYLALPGPPVQEIMMPEEFYKTGKIPLIFAQADAFLKMQPILLPKYDIGPDGWIIGRDDPKATLQGKSPDIAFPETGPELLPRHARLFLEATPDLKKPPQESDLHYRIEALDGALIVNGELLEAGKIYPNRLQPNDTIQLGKEGKKLTFKNDPGNKLGYFEEEMFPLDPNHPEWRIGRNNLKTGLLEIPMASIDRQVSRLHGRILRDEDGQYYIQDLSEEGTWVNDFRVYGTQPLYHKDKVQLGGTQFRHKNDPKLSTAENPSIPFKKFFYFELPRTKQAAPIERTQDPLGAPRELKSPPPTAVHPAFRGWTPEQVEREFPALREQREKNLEMNKALKDMGLPEQELRSLPVVLGTIKLSDRRELELEANITTYILGSGSPPAAEAPQTLTLELAGLKGVAARHAKLYVDGLGRIILEDLGSPEGLFIHGRKYRDVAKQMPNNSEVYERQWQDIPENLPALQRVTGWTVLHGHERIFLGKTAYFDFVPGAMIGLSEPSTEASSTAMVPANPYRTAGVKASPYPPSDRVEYAEIPPKNPKKD